MDNPVVSQPGGTVPFMALLSDPAALQALAALGAAEYETIPEPRYAIQYDGTNASAVNEALRQIDGITGTVTGLDRVIHVRVSPIWGLPFVVDPGDWLVFGGHGVGVPDVHVVRSETQFQTTHRPAAERVPHGS